MPDWEWIYSGLLLGDYAIWNTMSEQEYVRKMNHYPLGVVYLTNGHFQNMFCYGGL